MNMLITGVTGFIGRSCKDYFISDKYTVFTPTHLELDICDLYNLQKFINDNNIEYIIHTAAKSGRKNKLLTPADVYYGLLMFENIVYAAKDCKCIINFGSGAELGEYPIENISLKKEDDIYNIITKECGGFVKSIMTKRILTIDTPTCFNLRIAGCFGIHEKNDRFIKGNLLRILNNKPIEIYQNQYMDFIYVNDLIYIIDYILQNCQHMNRIYRDLNCVYTNKYTLLDIACMIKNITKTNQPINILKSGLDNEYTLDNTRLGTLRLKLLGIEQGIQEMYQQLKLQQN
jgi:nucleoside-diphosphate-sugar epimerase